MPDYDIIVGILQGIGNYFFCFSSDTAWTPSISLAEAHSGSYVRLSQIRDVWSTTTTHCQVHTTAQEANTLSCVEAVTMPEFPATQSPNRHKMNSCHGVLCESSKQLTKGREGIGSTDRIFGRHTSCWSHAPAWSRCPFTSLRWLSLLLS